MARSDRLFHTEIIKIALPSLFAIALFAIAIFGVVLPAFQDNLLEEKKKAITAVIQSAWGILAYYEKRASSGEFSTAVAQDLAKQQIRELRYGSDGKNYFWINDMQPKMVMHAYRPDLEGQDLSNFSDPVGKKVFQEFVDVVKKSGEGYVQYMWQWNDDQKRLVPKISYVKSFQPWGWIVGTGVYIEDIRQDIAVIIKRLIYIFVFILITISVLSLYIIRNSLDAIHKRQLAEKQLNQYKNSLEGLVEKRTAELQEALSNIKTLTGFLPICASCKKIRDDKGYWNQLEAYIQDHSEAEFSHSICPGCAQKLYPELDLFRTP
jgi:signal transduction histidine kinase